MGWSRPFIVVRRRGKPRRRRLGRRPAIDGGGRNAHGPGQEGDDERARGNDGWGVRLRRKGGQIDPTIMEDGALTTLVKDRQV